VPERVPTNPFLNANSFCGWSHVLPQYCLAPKWVSTAMLAGGENPILRLAVEAGLSLDSEHFSQYRMDWHWFLRRLGLAFIHDTGGDRSGYIHRAVSEINVLPLESEQFALS